MTETALWSGLALVSILDAYILGDVPAGVGGVSIDSRSLAPGDLFFAIHGVDGDGHDFVRAAFAQGAAAAVIEESRVDDLRDIGPVYVVRDTLEAMNRLGAAARARTSAKIVAVTGSVGKTSTKEALRFVLAAQGSAHASVASYNNHWGVPLSLARMPRRVDYAALEVGMNHAGEITPLAQMIRPHAAIVTTIAPVHLENLGSLEAIADAKAEIFQGMEPGGIAILHRDVDQYERLQEAAWARDLRVVSFGQNADADARLVHVDHLEDSSRVFASIHGRDIQFGFGAPGRHFALDALAALLAVEAVGGDVDRAAAALSDFKAPVGRGRRIALVCPTGPFTLIDESYNANPASMQAAFEVLGRARPALLGNRIAVLGDMLELGPEGPELHRGLRAALGENAIDQVFAAGPLMKALYDDLPEAMRGDWAAKAEGLLEPLKRAIAGGDVVMIKGSNSSRMGPLAAALEHAFAAAQTTAPAAS
jgi:UDP-N-acetylmuramoyl-tripeptide--D-alanyl-D-alanine ligase